MFNESFVKFASLHWIIAKCISEINYVILASSRSSKDGQIQSKCIGLHYTHSLILLKAASKTFFPNNLFMWMQSIIVFNVNTKTFVFLLKYFALSYLNIWVLKIKGSKFSTGFLAPTYFLILNFLLCDNCWQFRNFVEWLSI